MIAFRVYGGPVPKQSFKMGNGGGYTPKKVKDWQNAIGFEARLAMDIQEPLTGELAVSLIFYLPDRRRRDLDNLSKAVLDAMNKIVYQDDQQVTFLQIRKVYGVGIPGVDINVVPADRIIHFGGLEHEQEN